MSASLARLAAPPVSRLERVERVGASAKRMALGDERAESARETGQLLQLGGLQPWMSRSYQRPHVTLA